MENDINFNSQMANSPLLRVSPMRKYFSIEELQRNAQYDRQSLQERVWRKDRTASLIYQQNLNQSSIVKARRRNPRSDSEIVLKKATKRRDVISQQAIIETNSLLYAEASLKHPKQALEDHFSLREGAELRQFIEANPFLLDLLLESQSNISNYFPKSELALQVITNPEGVDDRQLVLFIITNLSPEDALAKLQQFDDAWWVDALDRAQGKLCITLEFQ